MRRHPWGLYATALAILVVGLVAVGVPASTLLFAALVLACPLMMMFMMGGMHSGHGQPGRDGHDATGGSADGRDRAPAGDRRQVRRKP